MKTEDEILMNGFVAGVILPLTFELAIIGRQRDSMALYLRKKT